MPYYYPELKRWSMIARDEDWNLLCDLLRSIPKSKGRICLDVGTGAGGCALLLSKIFPTKTTVTIDTFAGIPDPSPEDEGTFWRGDMKCSYPATVWRFKDNQSENIAIYRCRAEDWFRDYDSGFKNAVVCAIVDANLYSPTLAALKWLQIPGRMVSGAIAIVDDFPYAGVRKALDESELKYETKGRLAWVRF